MTREVRLWYKSLRPIVVNWQALQDKFRTQYSKIGNTQDNYFMLGDCFICDQNKTSSSVTGLEGTADIRHL